MQQVTRNYIGVTFNSTQNRYVFDDGRPYFSGGPDNVKHFCHLIRRTYTAITECKDFHYSVCEYKSNDCVSL